MAPRRRRILIGGLVLALVLLLFSAAAVRVHDLAAADRLVAACMRIRSGRDVFAGMMRPMMELLFAEDAAFIDEVVHELGEEPCTEVERRLREPLSIGALETWQPRPWPADRMERLRGATERARERCPAVMAEALGSLGTEAEVSALAAEACDGMMSAFDGFASMDTETTQPLGLHEWVDQMEALADLLEGAAR